MSERIPPSSMVPKPGTFCEIVTLSREQKDTFLEHVALGAALHAAAARLGVPYMSVMRERKADEDFERDVQIAMAARGGMLLEIALEQCTVGVDKVLTHQGRISYEYPEGYELDEMGMAKPGMKRVPVTHKELVTSNPMLLALLKAIYPEQFKERVEVSTPGQGAATTIDEEQRRTLEAVKRDLVELLRADTNDPDEDLL